MTAVDPRLVMITGPEGLAAARSAWERLYRDSGAANIYLTYDWIGVWLEQFERDYSEMRIAALRDGDRLTALAPLVFGTERFCGVPTRTLTFAGGKQSCQKDFLLLGEPRELLDPLLGWLTAGRGEWDVAILDCMPEESENLRFLAREWGASFHRVREHHSASPRLQLPPTWEEFLAGMRKGLRSEIRRRIRRLKEKGELEFVRHRGGAVRPEHLEQAAAIEGRSWKVERSVAIFLDDRVREFHQALSDRAERGFEPDLAFLLSDGAAVGFRYGFVHAGIYYAYSTSYDREFHRYSPGNLLRFFLMEELIGEGIRTFDLGMGGDSYKLEWASSSRNLERLIVFNDTAAGRMRRFLYRAKILLRKLRRGAGE